MDRPHCIEKLVALGAASIFTLGATACSAETDDQPAVCRIDRPTDDGIRVQESRGEVFNAYNVVPSKDRLYLTYNGDEQTVAFEELREQPVVVDLDELTIKASIHDGNVRTECLD